MLRKCSYLFGLYLFGAVIIYEVKVRVCEKRSGSKRT